MLAALIAAAPGLAAQAPDEAPCAPCEELGTPVTAEQIEPWNIDVRPDGRGLPEGSGTAARGRAIFEFGPAGVLPHAIDGVPPDPAELAVCPAGPTRCALCHGEGGSGGPSAPRLVGGRSPDLPPRHPVDPDDPVKTVGSYWPFATTLFDYIRRAMPFDCPGSLTDDEVYSVTAYLLFLNGILGADEVLDRGSLPAINERMPNHPFFEWSPPPFLPKGPAPPLD